MNRAHYWSTTEVIREPESGLDYDVQAYSPFGLFCKKMSDKRPWADIRRELDQSGWDKFYKAVKQ